MPQAVPYYYYYYRTTGLSYHRTMHFIAMLPTILLRMLLRMREVRMLRYTRHMRGTCTSASTPTYSYSYRLLLLLTLSVATCDVHVHVRVHLHVCAHAG